MKVVTRRNPAPPHTLLNIEKGARGFRHRFIKNSGVHEPVQDFLHQPTNVILFATFVLHITCAD
jgi:hypothetical protein